MKIMATSFKRSHAHTATLSAPDTAAGHHRPTPLPETPRHSRASLGQSLVESLLPSPGSSCAQSFVCALHMSVSPVLCKFWQFCGVSNGDLLQQGLCHTQVYCTQSPCPCISPLQETLKHSSVSVSVGSLGPGAHKVLFLPSKSLFPPSCVNSGTVGLMATSSKRAYAISRSAAPRTPAPAAVHCLPVLLQ